MAALVFGRQVCNFYNQQREHHAKVFPFFEEVILRIEVVIRRIG